MKQLYTRSRSLRRLLSATIGRRSREEGRKEKSSSPPRQSPAPDVKPAMKPSWRCFSYEEIHRATNGFHKDNLVGRGGCAEVFRGVMEDGQAIAVKRMTSASSDEKREKDFLTELGTVGHVRHPNVSALLGCCIDRGLHLIFEFSSRGSVSSNLHDEESPPMAWKLRYNIAVGTAKGLHFLHKGCQRRIIHRDIKASNILLTADFHPQISDFGLAKWLPSESTYRAAAPIEGTFGYLAPEYFMHGIVDEKIDVFAFGVFLLEIISGRQPVDGSRTSLISWARPLLKAGTTQMLVDPRLGDDYDMEELKRLSFTASLCIRATAVLRPSMAEVMEILEAGKISQEGWTVPEEDEDEEEEFWGFDELDDGNSDSEEECGTPSIGSCQQQQFSSSVLSRSSPIWQAHAEQLANLGPNGERIWCEKNGTVLPPSDWKVKQFRAGGRLSVRIPDRQLHSCCR